MRSSVTESRPSGDVRTHKTESRPDIHAPDSQRRAAQTSTQGPKRRFVFVPVEGWFSMLLLMVAASCVVFSMNSMSWVHQSPILFISSAAGLVVGFVVAKIRHFPQVILHLGAVLVGHWLSIWLISVVAFHISWLLLLENLRVVLTSGLTVRVAHSSDMVFLFYLCFLCFFLGYFGAWLTYRARLPWLVALVYCSILLVTLNAGGQDIPLLIIVLSGSLILLIARIHLALQIATWTREGLYTDRSWLRTLSWRFMQITTALALLTLLLSWLLPIRGEPAAGATFWAGLDNIWSNISHGQISWQDPGSLALPYQAPANFFGDQLSITGNVNLPIGEVLSYTMTGQTQQQYLEGFTYDHFDGHTWTSVITTSQNVPANSPLPSDTQGSVQQVNITVTLLSPPGGQKHFIFAPAQPSTFDVDTTVYGGGMPSAWAKTTPFSSGDHYQAQSLILTDIAQSLAGLPLTQELQNILQGDVNYPVLESDYLQLPSLPALVSTTAQQWTAGATDAYDAMKMLERRLSDKAAFTYAVSNPPVPDNVDAVSWLLQTHRGYCTYYATAMVMMARILGMPARMVNGFSQGHYDVQRKVWVVNGSDAHSWVQVYFPSFGWVNFDPTPGYVLGNTNTPPVTPSPVPTQTSSHPTPTPAPTKSHLRPTPQPGSRQTTDATPPNAGGQNLLVALSLGTVLVSLLIFLLALCTYWWRGLFANASFVSGMYWRVCRLAAWAGLPAQSWQTPYEYSRMLARQLPQEVAPLRRLTELFVRERWAAPHEVPFAAEEDDLERLWPHFRRLLLRLFLRRVSKGKGL